MMAAPALSWTPSGSGPLLTGLVAPTFSPFHANGTLDIAGIDRQAAYLRSTNVSVVFCSGTTGESVDLTVVERKAIAERWVSLGGFRVIVHVGSDSVVDAKDMASHAAKIGAWAVAAMPPTFIRPKNVDALVATVGAIAGAAPNLPFFYYHIPAATFVDLPMRDFLKAADGKIPNLAGIKYTHYDLMDLQLCMQVANGKYTLLYGRDQWLLSAIALGVHGAVGSTYNFNGDMMSTLFNAFDGKPNSLAAGRATQLAAASLIAEMDEWAAAYPGMYSLKTVQNLIAADVGASRLPFLPTSEAAAKDMKKRLMGWCAGLSAVAAKPGWCSKLLH